MARLKFKNGIVEDYTIVLSTRDYRKLGQIQNIIGLNSKINENSANEVSFTTKNITLESLVKIEDLNLRSKLYDYYQKNIWQQLVDLKLIWIKELDEYYEITVSLEDSDGISKRIVGKSLCESELSQINITAEINTEDDIKRDDYEITTFYNAANPKASLLNRVLSKAPHYKIAHVDESLVKIQRTFKISNSTIYNFLTGECAEQFNCIFKFDTATRSISVYDLMTVCGECGERGEFYDRCPSCGSTHLKIYGKDTTIFVDKNNLSDQISCECDASSIKNCFKLEAGDDLMTSTVRMLNVNSSNYIYIIPEYQRKDMSNELVNLLNEYDTLCDTYKNEHESLASEYYELVDRILYLESSMLPTVEHQEITAKTEAAKLTVQNLNYVALTKISSSTSVSTVNSALKNYAKVYVKTGYVKIDIDQNATFKYTGKNSNGFNYGEWNGRFIVTNYSNEEDVAYSENLKLTIYDDYEEFVHQKVMKVLSQDENKEGSVFDVLAIENLSEFKKALKLYCKSRLESFRDAIQGGLDVLIQLDEADAGDGNSDGKENLYDSLYKPLYEKLNACEAELDLRQNDIDEAQLKLDANIARRTEIAKILDFEKFLGEYYSVFCAYKREDTYSNSNYISDGLTNTEIIQRAKEFIDVAKKELVKAANQKVTISSSLKNLLVIPEFEPILDMFEIGNWIRIKVDNQIYHLRLLSYTINFDNSQTIDVEFSSTSYVQGILYGMPDLIQKVDNISSSYGYVQKQAEKGQAAQSNIQDWIKNGLSNSYIQIKNDKNGDVIQTKNGLLFRSYDDINNRFEDKQCKITYNALAYTNNNWLSVRQAIGEHSYTYYEPTINS